MSTPLLTVSHLEKSYQKTHILHDISFDLDAGEVLTLLGPSGSGKSTLLRCLNGLEAFQAGTLTFAGEVITQKAKQWQQLRQQIGMVFQSYDLFPNRTVLENILLGPLKVQKRSRETVLPEVEKLLQQVGMRDYRDAYPRQLSGGQKQRIAIVRALALKPRLMLFDEVTASLDPEMVRDVLTIIRQLADTHQMTMLVVTHEMDFAQQISDQVLFLADGRIQEQTPGPQFFKRPQTSRAQNFLASMDF
ncbi:amino acid ABC transporter ATP-binding protein [Lactiplantibacillus mudanjiangensis]|uniref:Glutamine ABC transporter ATP-binding protein [Lactobacillus sp.] n=1 Tax=Lactiplantibacillus mudanjiangensis TaxID=1296538 RepID=A0A660E2B8_9LACO|nr:amino acid ABC transporter ATP-binding protein [Lactiplantibacillus mudanjiangensis]VDG19116.1 glutamine ABC transporter ATP-binding protein [Lactobacillus sp.] [Lactiplantibacillus mudanjiangensis]VDG23184.1 glutamine ABC transporter ATP-binding protein [Lactobacillus sp.] [Lactiplantibacillus mudanjiangensis]VDG29889.1 glutamine ABC transporter ATP-binding protein [Lactobacillus sp.] [Lactiplantibacillus mudanjiangensis]VDG33189.1 glutamine ABC transporter ATP-binding protein [Lactobacillu